MKQLTNRIKTRRNVYMAIGVFLVVANLCLSITDYYEQSVAGNMSFSLGYLLGGNIFVLIGFVFLRLAYKLQQNLKRASADEEVNSIGKEIS